MVSMGKIKATGSLDVAEYHLNGYFVNKNEKCGTWKGAGCEALGLKKGAEIGYELVDVMNGYSASGKSKGSSLVQNADSENRIAAFDMTMSAGKDLSILAGLDDGLREQIIDSHQRAVDRAFDYIENNVIYSRRGKKGQEDEQVTGLARANFRHMTSRGGDEGVDPLLHDHNLVINTVQRADGTFGTIDGSRLYEIKMGLGQAYRAELAKNIKESTGLNLEFYEDKSGNTHFKVSGISDEQRKHFSQRRDQVEAQLEEWKDKINESNQGKAADAAALSTRAVKVVESFESLVSQWKERALSYGMTNEFISNLKSNSKTIQDEFSLDHVIEQLTDKTVRVTKQDMMKVVAAECLKSGNGFDRVESEMNKLLDSNQLLKLGLDENKRPIYTTKQMYNIEQRLKNYVTESVNNKSHHVEIDIVNNFIDEYEAKAGFKLSEQQRQSIVHIATEAGAISAINGKAGAGKSTSMEVVKNIYEAKGYEILGTALAGKAVAELSESAGIKDGSTIDQLLIDLDNKRRVLPDKAIIVMDEAGMVGSKHMERILSHIHKANEEGKSIHLVTLGDVKQLQAVNAGPAAKLVQDSLESQGQETILLDEIRRQKEEWARTAAHDFEAGRAAEGLSEYYSQGKVNFYESDKENAKPIEQRFSAIEGMTDSYISDAVNSDDISKIQMFASTRSDVYQLNYLAHEKLKNENLISKNTYKVDTEFGEREFSKGDRIILRNNDNNLDVKNGWTATIQSITENTHNGVILNIKLDNGEERIIDTDQYNNIDWSYAITTHASQGMTIDKTHILAGGNMTDLHTFYVQMSRHKETATIHIDRQSTHDMMLEAEPTDLMQNIINEIEITNQAEAPEYVRTDFLAAKEFIKEHSYLEIDNDLDRDLESLEMLAGLASRERMKESVSSLLSSNRVINPNDSSPLSNLTNKERLKIAIDKSSSGIYQDMAIEKIKNNLDEIAINNDELKDEKLLQNEAEKMFNKLSPHEKKLKISEAKAEAVIANKTNNKINNQELALKKE